MAKEMCLIIIASDNHELVSHNCSLKYPMSQLS